MLRLVIDTALGYLGIGVAQDSEIRAAVVVEKPSAVTTLAVPQLDTLLQSTGHRKQEVQEIVVSAGPGSFTGLRTGLSLAKGLGMALDIPLVPVSTLDAMVYTVAMGDGMFVAAVDGKNRTMYLAEYRCTGGAVEKTVPERVIGEGMHELQRHYPVHLVGTGAGLYEALLKHLYPSGITWHQLDIRAMSGSLARIAHEGLHQTRPVPASDFIPLYLREPEVQIKHRKGVTHEKDSAV